MAEKVFSVVAEMADATTKSVTVRGQTPSEAFRKVRDMPDVRRVGRVTEVTTSHRGDPDRVVAPPVRARAHEPAEPRRSPADLLNHVITGPRTVVYAPPAAGGEQPFKHLKAPPERPRPTPAPQPPILQHPTAPEPQASGDESASAPATIAGPGSATPDYRIVKSRRRDGLPYLLQRGGWQQSGGKRTFDVAWEKAFDDRTTAERHLDWIRQAEQEMAGLHQSA